MAGEFRPGGRPVWPGLRYEVASDGSLLVHTPDVCPNGHPLGPGTAHFSWDPGYSRRLMTCWTCYSQCEDQPDWVLVEPAWDQLAEGKARGLGLELVTIPPASPATAGRIEVRFDRRPVGHVEAALCSTCRVGVIERLAVDEPERRRGLGRVLVLAALSRGRGYAWSTSSPDPAGFWAALAPMLPARFTTSTRTGCGHIDAEAT